MREQTNKMRVWIFILITVPCIKGQIRETEFECGSHGRFEYCIDGVPGCVIGCHCHPGYYFDTDTKICEPNIRLTQHFRRNNYEEPTRVYIPQTPPTIDKPAGPPKTAVDEKIDIIAQDADDLGDWLYNQFFKTIENQVINETKDESIKTRRSENPPDIISKPTRRSHKYWRSKKKKKKRKKKGLRGKLLRITEDDSLFDSSSSSTSDESSETSSSSASERDEKEKSREFKFSGKSDHGHKKIVVLNKRPKPPLPSFIFLPNMETPFFPPIGLPAPPVPMYPMVPVPPMMGPYPYPFPTPCNGDSSTTDAGTTAAGGTTKGDQPASQTSVTTGAPATTQPADQPATTDADEGTDNPPENKTEANENEAPTESPENAVTTAEGTLRRGKKDRKNRPRNKLIQKLRDKLKRKNKLQNYFAQTYQNPEMQMMAPPELENPENLLPLQLHGRQKTLPEINVDEELATLQDIDFKYLSQLIHRADLNRTNQNVPLPMLPLPSSTPVKDIMLTVPPPSRRNYGGYPDQMTQALSNLANHPTNLKPENQPVYHTLNQNGYLPDPPAYNSMSQFVGNQPTYKPLTPPSSGTLNQQMHNTPNQQSYNAPYLPPYNKSLPNQSPYNVPDRRIYNELNKLSYLNQTPQNKPINPNYYAPIQESYKAPNLAEPQFTNNNMAPQQMYNVPSNQQPRRASVQAPYVTPNRQPYIAPNQQAYNPINQRTYNEPTYVSLNKPARNVPHRKKIEDTNDSYYSNLGRQIATMIRNIDGNQNVDIEIQASSNVANNPIVNDNGGSRSYWERYVRSPYNMINSFKKEIKELKNSDENLYSLENKVSMAALKEPTMSLHELENIISQMQETKTEMTKTENKRPYRGTEPSKTNFDINFLPNVVQYINDLGNKENEKIDWKLPDLNIPKQLKPGTNLLIYIKSNNSTDVHKQRQNSRELNVQQIQPLREPGLGSLLTSFVFPLQGNNLVLNQSISDTIPKIIPTRKTFTKPAPQIVFKMPNPYFKTYSYTALPLPPQPSLHLNKKQAVAYEYIPTTTKKTFYQQLSPMLLNHKNLHIYTGGNNNQYLFEKTSVPIKAKSFSRVVPADQRNIYETYGTRMEPSYFHHEVHHFDYFDDV